MTNFKIEIKWALIFALMMLGWMFMEKSLGFHDKHIDKHVIITNFVAIPAILIYVLALLEKKKKDLGGHMTYMQGFRTGLIITVIVTVLMPLVQYISTTYITPDYFTNAKNYAVTQGLMKADEADAYFNTKSYIMQTLIGTPVMGLLTTAIVAIFVRSKAK